MMATGNAGRPGLGAVELLLLTAAALVAGTSVVVWAGVQAAGLASGRGRIDIAVTDMPAVIAALPQHAADPAAAFPTEVSSGLPPGWVIWAGIATVVAVLIGAGALCAAIVGRRGVTVEPEPARWATRKDLRALHVASPSRGRLVLARHDGRLVAAEPAQAVIVLGPARSGKTSGLAIPAILEWDGPVIATSVRTDLLTATAAARSTGGTVQVFDPSGDVHPDPGLPEVDWRAGWNPLAGCRTWADAGRMAAWLCDAGRHGAGSGDEDFWYAVATKLLAPLLFAASHGGYQLADVIRWVDTQERAEVMSELACAGEPGAEDAAFASFNREARTLSSAYTTAEVVLRAFSDPHVLASTTRSTITPDGLLDGGAHTLFVCAPAHEQARLAPVFTAVLQQIITAVDTRHAATGQPLGRPLLIVLDEAANIAPLRNLDTLASTAAGTGIQLLTVWQDLAQITARYGGRAATVVNNHRGKLVLSGVSDEPTLSYVSRLLGDTEFDRQQVSRDADGRRSTSTGPQHRPLAGADRLRQIPPGRGVLIYGHLPAAEVALRPWFADKTLRTTAAARPVAPAGVVVS